MISPRIWYDYREPTLVEAFAMLKCLLQKEKTLASAPPFWRRWPITIPLLIIGQGIAALPVGIVFVLIGAMWIFAYRWLTQKRLANAKNRRLCHTRQIMRGWFGWAFMFEFEIVWQALDAALQEYQLSLQCIFGNNQQNRLSQHIIAEYLIGATANRRVIRTAQSDVPVCRANIGTQARIAAARIAQELQAS